MHLKAGCYFLLSLLIVVIGQANAAPTPDVYIYNEQQQDINLFDKGELLTGSDEGFPKTASQIAKWLNNRKLQTRTTYFGGSYWLVAKLKNQTQLDKLVLFPYNTLVSRIETRIYNLSDPTVAVARYLTGGLEKNEFAFHYGNKIALNPNQHYFMITRYESDYFYTPPKLVLKPYSDFFTQITIENMIMMLCFGVGIALGLYNLLIYLGDRDVTHLYYALFTACWVFAWSQFFHIPDQIFNYYNPHLHWVGFTLIPITNILFFINLLKLKESFPRLSQASLMLGVVATLGVPLAITWPSFGFIWATLMTALTLCFGFYIGIRSWMNGFGPARYFVFAYFAMAIPNMIGNLTNLGVFPPIAIDLYLLGLIGTALDAMLLAFAVANKFNLIHDDNVELTKNLEQKVQLRTQELQQLTIELRDASESKSRFLANMSHEIRTPMTSIIGYADGIILGDIKPHERNHAIGVILQNSRHVLGLINDILDMSKIEANRLEIELIETDLFSTIAQIESLLGKQIRDKGLKFNVSYAFPLPDRIISDPTRLRQILLNLATNALKFTSVGRIELLVSCTNEQLKISVKDTGIGMTESEQQALFTAFYQADSSTSRKYGGTGLGLNISKSLATKLNGEINVYSDVGSGSEFCLVLELKTTAKTQWIHSFEDIRHIEATQSVAQEHQRNLVGEVLLAEDHPENRELIKRILERMGLTVTAVENGQDAVQATLDESFDLILLDIQMPIMDGEQAIGIMQATGLTTPIVALTANTMKQEVERYTRLGFLDHIAKPIDRSKFSHKIASYLNIDIVEDVKLPEREFELLKKEYINGLITQKEVLQKQYTSGDMAGLAKSVHAIKGTAGMFDCTHLYQHALKLDKALKADSVMLDSHLVYNILTEIDDILRQSTV